MRIVIALGGNALLRRGEAPDAVTQTMRLASVAPGLARIADTNHVVFVHGNGPQIGLLARESAQDHELSMPYPLAALSAETQGLIGSLLSQSLRAAGLRSPVITLITHTIVDPEDPAIRTPTKLIGASYSHRSASALARDYGWQIAADGDHWRRVVPSPMPMRIIELAAAESLLASGTTIIMGGGGGIPLTEDRGEPPIDAVIDKDYVAALIARHLNAELLVILTDVPGAITDFGSSEEHVIARTTPALLRSFRFPPGSMGPKVAAACDFVEKTGRRAAIGDLEHAEEVVGGAVGTQISLSATQTL